MKMYLVGGAVRNHLLGIPNGKDFDFAVEAESYDHMVHSLVAEQGLVVWQERPEYVTVRGHMVLPEGYFGGMLGLRHLTHHHEVEHTIDADFTLCRAEAMYHDNRHPSQVTPTDILTDLSRRDFTINAIAVAEDGTITDPYDGQGDIARKLLRTVGDPIQRFTEDPLRMFRAIRFAVKYRLDIHYQTSMALNDGDTVNLILTLPVERIRQELNEALGQDWFATMDALVVHYPAIGSLLAQNYPNLWFKATLEQ